MKKYKRLYVYRGIGGWGWGSNPPKKRYFKPYFMVSCHQIKYRDWRGETKIPFRDLYNFLMKKYPDKYREIYDKITEALTVLECRR